MAVVRRRGSIYDTRIAGLYDLEETIGRGHFAVVKVAKHVFTGEKVAVKVIDKTKLDPVSKEHLFQEVRCMKLVQHPNIVRLYEVIDTQTKLFLILELGDYDMFEYIMRNGESGIPENEAQRYFCQIIRAISYCHKLHVVHRDLKLENVVFVEKLGMVKLTDFGFSNLFTPGQQLDTSCGSLAYSAPEILLGDSYDAPAVDIWSLGVILYMMVCGRLPFQEANDSETLTKILDCTFTLPPHLSEPCQQLIRRMLVRDPLKRANLQEIGESSWVLAGDYGHAMMLPLVSREHISDATHEQIVEQMVNGNIAEAEDICRAVEKDEYSYITATYYLLIERHMRKERQEQAQKLITALTKSDSQLQLASLALSPRDHEMHSETTSGTACTCTDATQGYCYSSCVQGKLDHGVIPCTQVDGLVSPISKFATGSFDAAATPTSLTLTIPNTNAPSGDRRTRLRTCSIVREESEDDISVHLRSSRSASPIHGSPLISPSPLGGSAFGLAAKILSTHTSMEFPELIGRLANYSGASSNGRTTPDRSGSRSPSPSLEGRASPNVVVKYKSGSVASTSRKLPSISSSPHLVGICEEGEDSSAEDIRFLHDLRAGGGRTSPQTYSSIRMIRPRQAVVSPDVIRRYDKRVSSRSRRSTSCSSSEASDDEERRLSLIHTHHCRRLSGRGHDDDNDPPSCGGGDGNGFGDMSEGATLTQQRTSTDENGSSTTHHFSGKVAADRVPSIEEVSTPNAAEYIGVQFTKGDRRPPPLDARKLASKLQKLALAPIREMPHFVLAKFAHGCANRATHLEEETRRWFKPLTKPKSCEHLASPPTSTKRSHDVDDYSSFSLRLVDLKSKFRHRKKKKCVEPTARDSGCIILCAMDANCGVVDGRIAKKVR